MSNLKRHAYAIRKGSLWLGVRRYSYGAGTTQCRWVDFARARLFSTHSAARAATLPDWPLGTKVVSLTVTLQED